MSNRKQSSINVTILLYYIVQDISQTDRNMANRKMAFLWRILKDVINNSTTNSKHYGKVEKKKSDLSVRPEPTDLLVLVHRGVVAR